MKTKKMSIWKRWRAQPDEAFTLEMRLYLSQDELERITKTIFEMKQEAS